MANGWVSSAITFPVCEEFGTRKEAYTANAFEAEVVLRTAWDKRFEVVYDIYRENMSYPDVPNCLMASASILPTKAKAYPPESSDPTDVLKYQEALITMKYSTAEADANKLFIETLEPSVENLVQPYQYFQWGAAADSEDGVGDEPPAKRHLEPREAPGFEVVMMDYTVKWLQQEIIEALFFQKPGRIHAITHTTSKFNYTFAANTLLFTPGPITRSYTLQNVVTTKKPKPGWDYTCKFKYNPYTWNMYYRADQPGVPAPGPGVDTVTPHFVQIHYATGDQDVYQGYPPEDLHVLLPT